MQSPLFLLFQFLVLHILVNSLHEFQLRFIKRLSRMYRMKSS
nr:MAG TPA: hypothetical protein [Caudoviricetes sp.]